MTIDGIIPDIYGKCKPYFTCAVYVKTHLKKLNDLTI
jgi:hypothetical protein